MMEPIIKKKSKERVCLEDIAKFLQFNQDGKCPWSLIQCGIASLIEGDYNDACECIEEALAHQEYNVGEEIATLAKKYLLLAKRLRARHKKILT